MRVLSLLSLALKISKIILIIVVVLFSLGLGFLGLRGREEGIIILSRLILKFRKKRQNNLVK
jgi:hypothetical protein